MRSDIISYDTGAAPRYSLGKSVVIAIAVAGISLTECDPANSESKHWFGDILPPATAIVDYVIGLGKLSANEQFFDDAYTAVSL